MWCSWADLSISAGVKCPLGSPHWSRLIAVRRQQYRESNWWQHLEEGIKCRSSSGGVCILGFSNPDWVSGSSGFGEHLRLTTQLPEPGKRKTTIDLEWSQDIFVIISYVLNISLRKYSWTSLYISKCTPLSLLGVILSWFLLMIISSCVSHA